MNSVDNNPNYKKIYSIVQDKFNKVDMLKFGPFDESYFTLRVYNTVKKIVNKYNKKYEKEKLFVAALLHDIGKIELDFSSIIKDGQFLGSFSEEWKRHPEKGAPIAKNILTEMGHSKEFIQDVCDLIRNHDIRNNKMKKSFELKVLQDADLIADCGLSGFIRPFLYSGKFGRSIIDTINFIANEDRTNKGNKLNLEVSKKISEEEIKTQKNLVKEISKDLVLV